MSHGGAREAAIRALVYVRMPENAADERGFEMLRRIRAEHGEGRSLDEFKADLREQYFLLKLDERRAMESIPAMLKGHEADVKKLLAAIRRVATAGGPLSEEGKRRLAEVERLFDADPARGRSSRR
jgi:uncharacterized protein YihD (DUF1040 family)